MIYDTLTIKTHTKNEIKFESHFYEQIKRLLNKQKYFHKKGVQVLKWGLLQHQQFF